MENNAIIHREITHAELKDLDEFMTILGWDMSDRSDVEKLHELMGHLRSTTSEVLSAPIDVFHALIKEFDIVEGN